ncbi:ferritin-like domain-containing protein [Bacillus thuringiensis]|uniref:ferritin-like domain-containing protein n=1 Tax=Bacillus thuringiensis TaxID=1428 RepID=UPI000BF270C7|nr:ferritin-like protein [Bacillus thuringiensis]PEY73214.1 hypothetical protein CN355_11270 [Bacillus thuringiensis]
MLNLVKSPPPKIKNITELYEHLQVALEFEHSTIPPYLVAMYTIKPGTNQESLEIIRTVVVEEMLHMVLVANVLNAIGGQPNIDHPNFIPDYPIEIPICQGDNKIEVHLRKFSPEAIDTFLAIEHASSIKPNPQIPREKPYSSIAEFYQTIKEALIYFADDNNYGQELFSGDQNRQISSEFYYNSGGSIIKVHSLETALQALDLVIEQSHGGNQLPNGDNLDLSNQEEVSHYRRFYEIKKGRRFKPTDESDNNPTGPNFKVQWEDVYNMIDNPKNINYPKDSEILKRSYEFNRGYTELIKTLHIALNGEPQKLVSAVTHMFLMKDRAIELIKNPIPGMEGYHGGPSFQYMTEVNDI